MFSLYICIFAVNLNIFVHYNNVKLRLLCNNWMQSQLTLHIIRAIIHSSINPADHGVYE